MLFDLQINKINHLALQYFKSHIFYEIDINHVLIKYPNLNYQNKIKMSRKNDFVFLAKY